MQAARPDAPRPGAAPPLSVALREGSRAVHEQAERSAVFGELLAGRLPLERYALLVGQYLAVYTALERGFERYAGHPVVGWFADHRLRRSDRLVADLAALGGDAARLPATQRYVQRIEAVTDWPAGWVAHHYVRYLGDVSGGQVVRHALDRRYGDQGRRASSFYDFAALGPAPHFRAAYRARLDDLDLDEVESARVVHEARAAFTANVELLDAVAAHPDTSARLGA